MVVYFFFSSKHDDQKEINTNKHPSIFEMPNDIYVTRSKCDVVLINSKTRRKRSNSKAIDDDDDDEANVCAPTYVSLCFSILFFVYSIFFNHLLK